MSSYTDFSKPELANSPRPLRLAQGQVLYFAGAYGNLWRVCKGALRIDRSARDMDNLINIALAGDLLGVEALCAEPYVGTATAVVDCVVLPEPVPDEVEGPEHEQVCIELHEEQEAQPEPEDERQREDVGGGQRAPEEVTHPRVDPLPEVEPELHRRHYQNQSAILDIRNISMRPIHSVVIR